MRVGNIIECALVSFGPPGLCCSAHGMILGVLSATQVSTIKGLSGCWVNCVLYSHLLGLVGPFLNDPVPPLSDHLLLAVAVMRM